MPGWSGSLINTAYGAYLDHGYALRVFVANLKIDAICTFIRKVFATKNLLSGKFLVFFWLCSRPALASFLKSVRPIWCHWWWWCHPMSTSRQSHNSKSTFPKWFNQIKKSIFQELFKIFIPLQCNGFDLLLTISLDVFSFPDYYNWCNWIRKCLRCAYVG